MLAVSSRFRWRTALVLCGALSLAACGGGGSSGSGGGANNDTGNGSSTDNGDNSDTGDSNTNFNTPLSVAQFQQAFGSVASGVWRSDTAISFSQETPVEDIASFTVTVTARNVSMVSLAAAGSNQFDVLLCDGLPGRTQGLGDGEVIGSLSDPGDMELCLDSETTIEYMQESATSFRMTASCNGENVSETILQRLSDQAGFEAGSFNFDSSQFAGLDANSGVCAEMISSNSNMELPLPLGNQRVEFSEIHVAAPYEGAHVLMSLLFNTDEVTARSYTVTGETGGGSSDVEVRLSAAVFGGSPQQPQSVPGHSGTVTIESITAFTVRGSLDVVLSTGDTLVGSFEAQIN